MRLFCSLSAIGRYGANAPGGAVGLQCGELFARNANCVTRPLREGLDEIRQREDADAAQPVLLGHFLDRRLRALAAFLPIERERHARGRRARRADALARLSTRG